MERYRVFLFAGAILLLLSMPLTAFTMRGEFGGPCPGYFAWLFSMFLVFDTPVGQGHWLLLLMFLCAVMNIPQLIFPFIKKPDRGTSPQWVVTFSAVAFVILPVLVAFLWLGSRDPLIPREGYVVYQLGYGASAIGFLLKRRAAEGGRMDG